MSKALFGVFGASGFGREVMPVLRNCPEYEDYEKVFVDDSPPSPMINGHRVMSYQEYLEFPAYDKRIVVAIANAKIREELEIRCASDGVVITSIHSSNCVVMDDVTIDQGAVLCPFVTITSNVKIGKSFQANIYSYVAHDCIVGDYVTFAPRVHCNGNVQIDDHAYIGTGAIIKQGLPGKPLKIGQGAVVGMGAVVTKDVPPYATVIGNPARPLNRK